jgi:subtilisin
MPAYPRHTGRHIVLMRAGLGQAKSAQTLHRAAGLRLDVSSDCEGTVTGHHIAAGEGLFFHHLDAGIVHADPDQLEALCAQSQTGGALVTVEPERTVQAIQLASAPAAARETQGSWGLQATRVTASQFSGRGVRIAILDTGIDLQHPDFVTRSVVSQSFVAGESVADVNGHGTYCAGVACGPASPVQPPRYGVATQAELYIGKVIAGEGSGADGNILAGIDWAVRGGCAVISLSVGTPVAPGEPYSPIYEQVARRALDAGTLTIAAAGNASLRPDCIAPVDRPANSPSILAVAAIDVYLRIAPFSCGGVNPHGGEVNLAAPGVAIRSSWPGPDIYRTNSGTSMATPYVAGIAALLAEANPSIRGRALEELLMRSAKPLPYPARDVGAGLIQAP